MADRYPLEPEPMIDAMMTAREVSQLTGIREQTLAAWRCRKTPAAPQWLKLGRAVRYRESAVKAWLSAKESSTPKTAG